MQDRTLFNLDIPICTICLEEMTSDLTVTRCGHVFHSHCMAQSLDIRSVCPNCKFRVLQSQMQPLIYSIGNVSQARTQHLKFIEELNTDDQKEFSKLLDKNEDLFKEAEKLKYERDKYKRDFNDDEEKIKELEKKFGEERSEKEKYAKYSEKLKNKKKALKIDFECLKMEKDQLLIKMTRLEEEVKDFSTIKKLKLLMQEQEDDSLRKFREKYPLQEQAKFFYQQVLIKKVEVKNFKDQIETLKNEKKELEKAQIASELTSREFDKLKLKYEKNNEILKKFKQRVRENEDKEKRNNAKIGENSNNFTEIEETLSENNDREELKKETPFELNFNFNNFSSNSTAEVQKEHKELSLEKTSTTDLNKQTFVSNLFAGKRNNKLLQSTIANVMANGKISSNINEYPLKRIKGNGVLGEGKQQANLLNFFKK